MVVQSKQITLRPYQEDATARIRELFAKGIRRVILQLPTGGGKTVCFSDMMGRLLRGNLRKKGLILTHRSELLTQAGGTLAQFGVYPTCLTDKTKDKDINFGSRCMVAMGETYIRRLKKFPELANFDFIIIDEAHYGMWKRLLSAWDELGVTPYVVGATATPVSAVKRDPISKYWGGIVAPVQIDELIEIGSLLQCKTYSAVFNRSKLKSDSSNVDGFTEESQLLEFDKREVYAGLIEKFKKHCTNEDGTPKKTIVFNINIEHSKATTQAFIDAGFHARHVDGEGKNKETRTKNIKDFRDNVYSIINNVNILTAGFDDPSVECIIINKATKSIVVWLQAQGRGSRPFGNQTHFTVLDMAQNWSELQLWNVERDWEAIFWNRPSDRPPGAAPAKLCPECGYVNSISAKVCADPDCEYVFPVKAKKESVDPEFIEITQEYTGVMTKERRGYILEITDRNCKVPYQSYDVKTLIDIQAVKGYGLRWALRMLREKANGNPDEYHALLQEYADWKKYKQGWVVRQWDEFLELV